MKMVNVRRRVSAAIIVALATLSLSGCLDVFQTVEFRGDTVRTAIRITFSKSLLEAAASMSGEAPDYSELPDLTEGAGLDEIDVPGVRFETRQIDTATDYGVAFFIQYDMDAVAGMSPEERQFIPAISETGLDLLLPPNGSDEGMDEMSGAILGGAKYRLMVGTGGRQIRSVSVDGDTQAATFAVVGDVALVEVPLFLWLGSPDGVLVSVKWE